MQINKAKKIVIKLGSSSVVSNKGKFKKKWLLSLIQDIKKLRKNNQEIVIVSSGSIALGQSYLKIKTKKVMRMFNIFNLNSRAVVIKVKYCSVTLKHLLLKQVILQSLQIRLFT